MNVDVSLSSNLTLGSIFEPLYSDDLQPGRVVNYWFRKSANRGLITQDGQRKADGFTQLLFLAAGEDLVLTGQTHFDELLDELRKHPTSA